MSQEIIFPEEPNFDFAQFKNYCKEHDVKVGEVETAFNDFLYA